MSRSMRWLFVALGLVVLVSGLVLVFEEEWLGWVMVFGSLLLGVGLIVVIREDHKRRASGSSPAHNGS